MDTAPRYQEPSSIDYRKLAAALDHYEARGYKYVETPWVVSSESVNATLPPEATATKVQYGYLVGSAEQGFIELFKRGELLTKACAITPCFRIEDTYDSLHHAYFMKLELINTDVSSQTFEDMVRDAREYYEQYTSTDTEITGVNMIDIVDKTYHIELGSYGIRQCENASYIYGTGLALPRLDTILTYK